jgi:hypothetical protein
MLQFLEHGAIMKSLSTASLFAPRRKGCVLDLRLSLGTLVLSLAALLTSNSALAQSSSSTIAKDPKLSSILVDLRDAVAQRHSVEESDRSAFVESFSANNLPRSVKDAIFARSLRLSAKAEVQASIEMSALDTENLATLKELGVIVEIQAGPDAQRGSERVFSRIPMVQAEVPVEVIQLIEDLPFVRFLRLPHYAISGASSASTPTPSLITQGDTILRALTLRSTLGVTGAGIHVGVISSGIGGLFQTNCTTCNPVQLSSTTASPILSGDLPGSAMSTGTRDSNGNLTAVSSDFLFATQSFRAKDGDLGDTADGPNGAEGSAMLEIIHHLAPDASLSFANSDTDLEFEKAVNYLAAQNDVVVDDESFLEPSYDGTSAISQNTANALNDPANPIRAYVTNAGNYALNHYSGAWADSLIDGSRYTGETGDMHLFSGVPAPSPSQSAASELGTSTVDEQNLGKQPFDPLISLPAMATVQVGLSWDDPTGASSNDFDLFLVPVQCTTGSGSPPKTTCNLLSGAGANGSTNRQSGGQDPYEELTYTNTTSASQTLAIVIQNYQNSASTTSTHNFDMFVIKNGAKGTKPNHNYYTISGSIPAEADATGSPVSVITVGAINQSQCDSAPTVATPDNCTGQLEVYSGQGPTEITPQSKTAATKPNLTAVDQVCITGAGEFGNPLPASGVSCPVVPSYSYTPTLFGGTSAAAPHVAAIAALALQMAPCLLASGSAPTAAAANFARETLFGILTGIPASTTGTGANQVTTPAVPYASPLSGYNLPMPNNAEGWGLVDAYSSASLLLPIPGAQNTISSNPNLIASVSALNSSGAPATLTVPSKLTNLSSCPVTDIEWAYMSQTTNPPATGSGTATGTEAIVNFPIGINRVTVAPSINNGVTYPPIDLVPYANVIVTDFSLSVSSSTPAPVVVPSGTPAVFTVTVTSTEYGYFTNPVALSCQANGLPSGAMCVFSPATVTPSVASSSSTTQMATSTLTIYTSGVVGQARHRAQSSPHLPLGRPLLVGVVLLLGVRRLSRCSRPIVSRWFQLLAMAALMGFGVSSCGGTHSTSSTPPSTTYTVTVLGTSSQLARTTTLTLTVQ